MTQIYTGLAKLDKQQKIILLTKNKNANTPERFFIFAEVRSLWKTQPNAVDNVQHMVIPPNIATSIFSGSAHQL